MQQHLRRLDGVDKVEVSLLNGTAVITPKPDGPFDPAAVLKAAFDSGVSLVEMTIVAEGKVEKTAQGWEFTIAPNRVYPIDAGAFGDRLQSGTKMKLKGRLFKKPPGKQKVKPDAPLRFEVMEIM